MHHRMIPAEVLNKRFIAAAGALSWAADSLNGEIASDCDVDSSGNIYVVGYKATSSSAQVGFLLKYSSMGVLLLQKEYALSGVGACFGVAVDSANSCLYVTCAALTGTAGVTVLKLNLSGVIQWQRNLSEASTNHLVPRGVATDGSNVYVAHQDNTNNDTVFTKYNSSGTLQWQRELQATTLISEANNIAGVDGSGNVYGVASKSSPTIAGGTLAQWNSSGTIQWQRRLSAQYTYDAKVTSAGNTYCCGDDNGTTSKVHKYDSTGALQWQRQVTSGGKLYALALDASENVYCVSTSGYVFKWNSSGTLQWQRRFTLTGSYATLINLFGIAVSSSWIVACGTVANQNGSDVDRQAITLQIRDDGTVTATVNVPGSAWRQTSVTYGSTSLTEAAGGGTDAAGNFTEAAGGATDAAGSYSESTPTHASATLYLP